jgi:hypothetical protein
MDSVDLAHVKDRLRTLVNKVVLSAGKFLSSCTSGGLSRKPQLRGVI